MRTTFVACSCVLAMQIALIACTDQPVTEDFGKVVECDDGNGAWVDHGVRGERGVEFDPACMPKCGHQRADVLPELCPAGLVFWTVPVKITAAYPSGNLCYCDVEFP